MCNQKCLQCNGLLAYHVNPSLFHGLCETCATSLESSQPLDCIHCGTTIEIIFLSKNPKVCQICSNLADVKHKTCKHLSCSRCRVNDNCPICVCILCKEQVFNLDLCKTHKLCRKCTSKFNLCPWCACQYCGNPELSLNTCNHPICLDCLSRNCKLCGEICSFCKNPTNQLKGNFCKSHWGCLDCYENFISKDRRCHYCSKDYQNYKCQNCEKFFFNIKLHGEDNKRRLCEQCFNQLRSEEEKSPQVTKIVYQFNQPDLTPCHYCKKSDHNNLKTNCQQGFYCVDCEKYNKIGNCVSCDGVKQGCCEICKKIEYVFNRCQHDLCLDCAQDCSLCKNVLMMSQVCFCSDQETCLLCEDRKKIMILETFNDCFVCGRENVHCVLKPCQHHQCKHCMTGNQEKEKCSRCLNQYKCEKDGRNFLLLGECYVLKCCKSYVCKYCRKEINIENRII